VLDNDNKLLAVAVANANLDNEIIKISVDGKIVINATSLSNPVPKLIQSNYSKIDKLEEETENSIIELDARIDAIEQVDASYNMIPYIEWGIGGITNTGG
jgi:hypothetical protein